MMKAKGVIDSLNFKDNHLEALFIHKGNYTLNKVKGKGDIYKPKDWVEAFGKEMGKIKNGVLYFPFVEAIIISDDGSSIKFPLKRYAGSPKSQTVEFAGLNGYTDRSRALKYNLLELWEQLQYMRLARADVSFDFAVIDKSIIKKILKGGRQPHPVGTSTYYKTKAELKNEKKTNTYLDVKIYDKREQLERLHGIKLDNPLWRLEFCFKAPYLKDFKGKDIREVLKDGKVIYSKKLIKKMEKTIKSITGKSMKINPFK